MSIPRSTMKGSDPIIMTQIQVNQAIAAFFEKKGCTVKFAKNGTDVDLIAEYKSCKFLIESRGNQAVTQTGTNQVFDNCQIGLHLSEQLEQIMRFQQQFNFSNTIFYILANPDIPRIRERVGKISKGLDKLGIIQAWVQADGNVVFEGEKSILLNNLLL
ncbi:hypothetical protein [Bacillus tuaregi]|uniref:hypothetical protein n=1 Tax=Bacillus tuaregi TaxID=1816695 RepID=UPI0008F8E1C6|nr:hypothetical protein [Bacillus tuaregi]